MPKTKRKFIDKKHATTFHLVHRSQHDPLVADENAPQHVLVSASQSQPNKKPNIEEQQKFGIYFDDDYNYLQHLKPVNATDVEWVPVETANKNQQVKKKVTEEPDEEVYRVERPPKLVLPSSVFASEVEEEVGMLNKAAPQGLRLDLDPDIVAAMDEDFDFDDPDNILDDDFIQLANAPGGSDEDNESDGSDTECGSDFNNMSDYDDEALDEVGSLDDGQRSFMEEETKSRFTDYSMSSSVIRRNNQLTLLDDRFENMFSQYDDTKIGPLDQDSDDEDGIGFLEPNSERVLKCVDEFDKAMADQKLDKDQELDRIARAAADNYESESDDDSYRELRVKDENEDEKWDCQSILSTYSTTSNRPKLISERNGPGKIRISNKTGVPIGVIDANKLTAKALAQLDEAQNVEGEAGDMAGPRRPESIVSMLSTLSVRPKDETPEERKARKKALKEYRRERVIERKANTAAFGEEKKRQEYLTKIFSGNPSCLQLLPMYLVIFNQKSPLSWLEYDINLNSMGDVLTHFQKCRIFFVKLFIRVS